jgi:hypothetical protein
VKRATAGVVLAATSALTVNLVLYAIGKAAGGAFSYRQARTPATVDPSAITILTLTSMGLGLGIALAALRRWPRILLSLQVGATVIGVGSIAVMTIPAHFDTTSTLFLAAMHLSAIPIAVTTLSRAAAAVPRSDSPGSRRPPTSLASASSRRQR